VAADETNNAAEEQATVEEADAVQKKASTTGGGGGPNPKIILAILVLNTVVVIALAAVVWMGAKKSAKEVSLGDIAASDGKEAGHGEGEPGKAAGGHGEGKKDEKPKTPEEIEAETHVTENFTVNLADGTHYAQVTVAIEVLNPAAKNEVVKLKPKIRDFVVVILSSKTYEQIESVDGRDFLREEIRNKINGYLTRGQINNVYFTQFIVQ